ncbi:MAG: tyrosine--tRNA ligase, partial [Hyphomonas sp.]|nr:tyrosine--tRNA ligase [Hyphomonas sp.]
FSDYLVAAAFTAAGLTESNGEARRLIKQGAAKVNDQQVKDQNATLAQSDVVDGSIKLSAGKKRHALVKPV